MLASRLFRFSGRSNVEVIREALSSRFSPSLLEVSDESRLHYQKQDSHFNVYIVSESFAHISAVQRHRLVVNHLKAHPLLGKLHAVTLAARTPQEHQKNSIKPDSPVCMNFPNKR